jgi:gluconate 2-dehydrogenase gamma chain
MRTKTGELRRRTLLCAGLSAAAGAAISCGRGSSGGWRFFTDAEARLVDAISALLIPTDEFPGAREAGVVRYIDLQLSQRFRRHQATYRKGLAQVDEISRKACGKPFLELAGEQQNEALIAVEEQSKAFFALILAHTRQGFYGDPRHGGNRDRVSWRMLALPTPPVRGRQHYDDVQAG